MSIMSMRIAKYPQVGGLGLDVHAVWPGSLPPVPPAPVNPAPIPGHRWLALITVPLGALLTGKYTTNCITEFIWDILVGHDWGPGQPHIPLLPVTAAPNIIALTLTSSHTYFLPAYSVQETPGGGALSLIGAGATPVAITAPSGVILVQDCWDITAVHSGATFQLPTTRWVGISWSDLIAGLVLMAGNALAAFVSGKINDKLVNAVDNKLIRMIKASENKKNLWDALVKGQKLMDALLDDKWGLCGLVLGAASTAVGNFASARFSSDDWGAADVVGIIVATPLGAPAVSVIADKVASAIADPS